MARLGKIRRLRSLWEERARAQWKVRVQLIAPDSLSDEGKPEGELVILNDGTIKGGGVEWDKENGWERDGRSPKRANYRYVLTPPRSSKSLGGVLHAVVQRETNIFELIALALMDAFPHMVKRRQYMMMEVEEEKEVPKEVKQVPWCKWREGWNASHIAPPPQTLVWCPNCVLGFDKEGRCVRPILQLRQEHMDDSPSYWMCPRCNASYGEEGKTFVSA